MDYPDRLSGRLKGYDYSAPGAYFVTFNTKDFYSYFGNIREGVMHLSESGRIIEKIWNEIPSRYKNTSLDQYIIMPDHFHGIIWINFPCTDAINRVRTGGIAGIYNPMLNPGSLSHMIRWFKGRCSFEIRKIPDMANFEWHPGFYEHIIRGNLQLQRIRRYIINNPTRY